jgi:16S rRNA (uracil1498-N3)-methyltransferase
MRYHRFIGNFDLSQKTIEVTDMGLISQWHSVLRLKTSDIVILCDGKGNESEAVILNMEKKVTTLSIVDSKHAIRGTQKDITLYVSILRRENFEIVVQKATEIGITKIVPLLTERTVKTGFNENRFKKIILEASEQSGRTILPSIAEPMKFSEAMQSINPKETFFFDISGKPVSTFDFKLSTLNLFIGPEGGFSEKEVQVAKDHGCIIASLGELTLRAETAAIVVSYLSCN